MNVEELSTNHEIKGLKENLRRHPSVQLLYQWMAQNSLSCTRLSFDHILSFFKQEPVKSRQQRTRIYSYIDVASASFPRVLMPGQIPPVAREFADSLRINLKPNTCATYVTYLRRFHSFLLNEDIDIKNVTRKHMVLFFAGLVDEGLAPDTRGQAAAAIRTYLYWLHEQQIIHILPEKLIHSTDFPKHQFRLPRPLPADVDRELQARLRASSSIYHKGILLMRHTGIRVGELVALPYDCLFVDTREYKFLKVPLGKLDNERNVPLDEKTYDLLTTIQSMGPKRRLYLIPREKRIPNSQRFHICKTLSQIARGLKCDSPISSHRLRHTYATSLVSAGINLFAVMRLLGHRNIHMTLRYTAITQENLLKDYHAAIKKLDYATPPLDVAPVSPTSDPMTLLVQTEHAFKRFAADNKLPASLNAPLLKRLTRLKVALREVLGENPRVAKMAR
jgi:site-specific recombinase XerD